MSRYGDDEDRDETDRGLSHAWTREDLDRLAEEAAALRRELRRREETEPSGPKASARVIDRVRAQHGFPRSRNAAALRRRCLRCGAAPTRWCRGRLGQTCAGRDTPEELAE